MAASLIGFFSVFNSVDLNQVSRQHKEHAVCSDAHTIAISFCFELEHVTAKIGSHSFHALSDIPPNLLRQCAQLLTGFLTDRDPITHRSSISLWRKPCKPTGGEEWPRFSSVAVSS